MNSMYFSHLQISRNMKFQIITLVITVLQTAVLHGQATSIFSFDPLSDEFIDYINNLNTTWKVGIVNLISHVSIFSIIKLIYCLFF